MQSLLEMTSSHNIVLLFMLSRLTLCTPMNCSMLGILVLHYLLLELAQTH